MVMTATINGHTYSDGDNDGGVGYRNLGGMGNRIWFFPLMNDFAAIASQTQSWSDQAQLAINNVSIAADAALQSSSAAAISKQTAIDKAILAGQYADAAHQSALDAATPVNITTVSAALANAADIGAGVPTRVLLDQSSNGNPKYQTLANFFNKVAQVLHFNANRGRHVTWDSTSANGTLVAGNSYGLTANAAYSIYFPTVANLAVGDLFEIFNVNGTWGSNVITINCPSGVSIEALGIADAMLNIDSGRIGCFRFACTFNNGSSAKLEVC